MIDCVIGVDVGTGAARAGVFDLNGKLIRNTSFPIKIKNPKNDYYEQSSQNIWESVCLAINMVTQNLSLNIQGIGFDATCSLVILDKNGDAMPIEDQDYNIIQWCDHRAVKEASDINQTQHEDLKFVGGNISPEMQLPKILWLKRNKPLIYKNAGYFMDLVDFLTYKCTGISDIRSSCTTVCKWNLNAQSKKWNLDFLQKIGLDDIQIERIGSYILLPGSKLPQGLSEQASLQLGIRTGVAVGVGIIDAHAGGIGILGAEYNNELLDTRLALIAGTSSCHMLSSFKEIFVNGVWGPYLNVMIPNMYLSEGGQSSSGSLIGLFVS